MLGKFLRKINAKLYEYTSRNKQEPVLDTKKKGNKKVVCIPPSPPSFPHGPLAKQGDVGKVPKFSIFRGRGGGPQKVGEVLLIKQSPGWCLVLFSCTVQ